MDDNLDTAPLTGDQIAADPTLDQGMAQISREDRGEGPLPAPQGGGRPTPWIWIGLAVLAVIAIGLIVQHQMAAGAATSPTGLAPVQQGNLTVYARKGSRIYINKNGHRNPQAPQVPNPPPPVNGPPPGGGPHPTPGPTPQPNPIQKIVTPQPVHQVLQSVPSTSTVSLAHANTSAYSAPGTTFTQGPQDTGSSVAYQEQVGTGSNMTVTKITPTGSTTYQQPMFTLFNLLHNPVGAPVFKGLTRTQIINDQHLALQAAGGNTGALATLHQAGFTGGA